MTGLMAGATPQPSLENVFPTLTYYDSGNNSLGNTAPTYPGSYSVKAYFPGSTDYASTYSAATDFTISPAQPIVTVSDAGGSYTGSALPRRPPRPASWGTAAMHRQLWMELRP